MLKLVYKAESIQEINPILEEKCEEMLPPNGYWGFQAEVKVKGPNLYSMSIHDYSNCLSTELTLEVDGEVGPGEDGTLICHFPKINDEPLNMMIWEDETLYAIIMIQFHMRIMKELLLFCNKLSIAKMVLYPDEENMEDFEIYQDLVIEGMPYEDDEDLTKLVLAADIDAYDDWIHFMGEAMVRFQQTLWRDQRANSAIKNYLSSHPFGSASWQI